MNAKATLPNTGLCLLAPDDIAIVGYSFMLPQGVNDDLSFWKVLQDRRNLSTSWPQDRINIESFVNNKDHKVRLDIAPGLW